MLRKLALTLLVIVVCSTLAKGAGQEAYEANWDSLRKHKVPQWAKDAKFGIYAHWGIYAIAGSWDLDKNWANDVICSYRGVYSTNVKNDKRREFEKYIGPVADGYGYKDLAKKFKVENFDPAYWADLIKRSGARYAGICAIHHDGYAMWNSDVMDFNAGKLGPKRDLLGEILTEIEKRGMKTMTSFHHARTYKHYSNIMKDLKQADGVENFDILDPQFGNYYWFLGDVDHFSKVRYDLTKEVIDRYEPDAIWFDGGGGAYGTERILADYFNMGQDAGKEVCVHNKGNFGKDFGVYSYENGHSRPLYIDWPWEDDTPSAIGWCDWPWFKNIEYKKPRDVVVRLCDLVARNGGLLLSMNPRPDGTFDQGQIDLLDGIGKWLEQNGDAIYDTVPWKIFAEGHTERLEYYQINEDGKKSRSIQPDPKKLDWTDVRFTRNGEGLYATVLGVPPSKVVRVKTLSKATSISKRNKIKSVELLGFGKVQWQRTEDALEIELPDDLPNEWALSFRIRVKGKLDKAKPPYDNSSTKMPKQT
ncbi:MAG: alpha-L-fucosidase [Phycisphaerae bacterium]|nr:alpha-L-fucosidase [Phycisphaerae bacterium]